MKFFASTFLILFTMSSHANEGSEQLTKAEQYLNLNPRLFKYTEAANKDYIEYFNENYSRIMDENENLRARTLKCSKEEVLKHVVGVANNITMETKRFAINKINHNFSYSELDLIRQFYVSPTAIKLKIFEENGMLGENGEIKGAEAEKLMTPTEIEFIEAYRNSELGKKEADFIKLVNQSGKIAEALKDKDLFQIDKLACADKLEDENKKLKQ